jgi:hypothetical protein
VNGNEPPSGNSSDSAPAGTIDTASSTPAASHRRVTIPHAASGSARNATATGEASAAAAPAIPHQARRFRVSASTASIASASPSANVSRPVTSETIVAVANHSAATRAPVVRRPTIRSNAHAVATAAAAPTSRGPSHEASGGKRIE